MDTWQPEDLNTLEASNAFILDVRQPEERMNGRAINNTKNIPLGELAARLDELPSKSEVIYVYCESGVRSRNACLFLESKGYRTSNLSGGYSRYATYKSR